MTLLETFGLFVLTLWFCKGVLWFGDAWDRMKIESVEYKP